MNDVYNWESEHYTFHKNLTHEHNYIISAEVRKKGDMVQKFQFTSEPLAQQPLLYNLT